MFEILQYEFMRNAIAAALLVSVACGVIGTYVVIKRIVFIGDGIAHSAFGGIGLGFFLGIPPVLAAIPFTILSAIGLGTLTKEKNVSEDTAIGVLLTASMALGIIFVGLSEGYAPDLFSYLFGNILTVPAQDLALMAALDLIIILSVAFLYNEFRSICFDEEFSRVVGMPVQRIYLALLCLIALTVVLLIRVVGVILLMALITIPAAIATRFASDIKRTMLLSTVLGILFTLSGLYLSYVFNIASGATIVLVSSAAFIAASKIPRRVVF